MQRVEDIYSAQCSICCKMFDISDMGERALTSHMKGKKHCGWVPTISRSQNSCFSESESIDLSSPSEGSNNHLSAHSVSSTSKSLLDSMMVSTSVAHAEICRALKTVLSKSSIQKVLLILDNYSKLCFQIVN